METFSMVVLCEEYVTTSVGVRGYLLVLVTVAIKNCFSMTSFPIADLLVPHEGNNQYKQVHTRLTNGLSGQCCSVDYNLHE